MTPKPPKQRGFTINGLAGLTGKDRRTVARLLGRTTPVRIVNGLRYYSEAQLEAAMQRAEAAPKTEKQKLEVAILRQRLADMQRDAKIKEGQLIDRADAEAAAFLAEQTVKATLQRILEAELPPQLIGLDAISIADRMRATIDHVCEKLQTQTPYAENLARLLKLARAEEEKQRKEKSNDKTPEHEPKNQ